MAFASPRQVSALLRREYKNGSRVIVRAWAHSAAERLDAAMNGHAGVEIAWVETGALTYAIGDREIVVRAGQSVVIPAEVEHATSFHGPTRAVALWLDAEMVAEVSDAIGRRGERLLPGLTSAPERILQLGRAIESEARQEAEGHLMAVESLAEALTISLVRGASVRKLHAHARDRRVLAALDLMHSSYSEQVTIDMLAKAAGMSRFHFSRIFREDVGESPYQHLTRVRLQRAAELLRGRRHSVTDAAMSVGFSDLSAFSRKFRAHFGVAPRQFALAPGRGARSA